MDDSLITILLALVAAIIGAISQGKKRQAGQMPPNSQPDSYPEEQPTLDFPDPDVIFRKLLQEVAPEEEGSRNPEPEPVVDYVPADLAEPEELKRQRELLVAVEGISSTNYDYQKEIGLEQISDSEIGDAVPDVEVQPKLVSLIGEIDVTKAVIYSEILNRKY